MQSRLLLLLLFRIGMGLSTPLEKSNMQPYQRLCDGTQTNRPLGAAEPLRGSIAIEADLPGSGAAYSGYNHTTQLAHI